MKPIVLTRTSPAVPSRCTRLRSPARHSASFSTQLTGDVTTTLVGEATFSQIPGQRGARPVFGLALGPLSAQGAVFFRVMSGSRPGPGTYPISCRGDGSDAVRATVVLGPVERPFGEFQARSGTLTIVSASDARLVGTFSLETTGLERSREGLQLSLSGSFTARAV
ncbi:MAG: hypothetical protein ACJ8DC_07960 [Gemmatimonadales bacterium]